MFEKFPDYEEFLITNIIPNSVLCSFIPKKVLSRITSKTTYYTSIYGEKVGVIWQNTPNPPTNDSQQGQNSALTQRLDGAL